MRSTLICVTLLLIAFITNAQVNYQWAASFGGSLEDVGQSVAMDASGNVYVTGYFNGVTDFDPGPGTYTLSPGGPYDNAFVYKLNAAGNLIWAKLLGGPSAFIHGLSITVDATGNVYTTGWFLYTADFDPGPGTFTLFASGASCDAFVTKLDQSGNLLWAVQLGNTVTEENSRCIKVDGAGNVYTMGIFKGTADFDPGVSTYTLSTTTNYYDVYLSKLNSSGNFVWAKKFTGPNDDWGESFELDASGNLYCTGGYSGTVDFDPSPSTYNMTSVGLAEDIFISKLDNSGNFIWAKTMGGSGLDIGQSIDVDASGNIVTTGPYSGVADFDPSVSTYTLASTGFYDVFISKLNTSGNFVWAKSIGGPNDDDRGYSVSIDAASNVYVTGSFRVDGDFDPSVNTYTLACFGGGDTFLEKLDASGNFIWAAQFPSLTSLSGSIGYSVFARNSNDVCVTGSFFRTIDCDPGAAVAGFTTTTSGYMDAFLIKLSSGPLNLNEKKGSPLPFQLFPNPISSVLQIESTQNEFENSEIEITNTLGQTILKLPYSNSIDVSKLEPGFYDLRISSRTNQSYHSKFIKE